MITQHLRDQHGCAHGMIRKGCYLLYVNHKIQHIFVPFKK